MSEDTSTIEERPEDRKACFRSKNRAYTVVIRQGTMQFDNAGNPVNVTPGVYAAFEEGRYDIDGSHPQYELVVSTLRKHKRNGFEFFEVTDTAKDPYRAQRPLAEPGHVIEDFRPGGRISGDVPAKRAADQKEMIKEMAAAMAKEMLGTVLSEMRKEQEAKTAREAAILVENPKAPPVDNQFVETGSDLFDGNGNTLLDKEGHPVKKASSSKKS